MQRFQGVRAVLLDVAGTVLYPDPPVERVYAQAAIAAGRPFDLGDLKAAFRAAFARQETLDQAPGSGATDEGRELARWQDVVAEVLGSEALAPAVFEPLWAHFAQPSSWRVFDDVPELLAALDMAGVPWGLASNFDRRLYEVCAGHPGLDQSTWVFASSQLGWRKPHPKFFRAIEEHLGLPPHEILLIGDDPVNDFAGAIACGWQAVRICRAGPSDAQTAVPSQSVVTSLRELWAE